MPPDKKINLYFQPGTLSEVVSVSESLRQDRSISWLFREAWRTARLEIQRQGDAFVKVRYGQAPDTGYHGK